MAHRVEGVLAQAAHSTGLTRAQLLRELNIPGALFSRDPRVSETTLARIKAPVLTAAKK
jgi:hypothetical protein